jgi:protein involved in polysaccharide export with SLBB domain
MKLGCLLLIGLLPTAALAQGQPPQTVTVTPGASVEPGAFAMPPNGMTVKQAIALSGGLRNGAGPYVVITRIIKAQTNTPQAETQTITVKLRDILTGKTADVNLQPGDVIHVPLGKKRLVNPLEILPIWPTPTEKDPRV